LRANVKTVSDRKNQVRLSIFPNTNVRWQFQIADFRFRVYHQFRFIQDPASDAAASNVISLNRFTNTVGASTDWLLGTADLRFFSD
jgi:hypothetical protein